jgi:hypothetical protein
MEIRSPFLATSSTVDTGQTILIVLSTSTSKPAIPPIPKNSTKPTFDCGEEVARDKGSHHFEYREERRETARY